METKTAIEGFGALAQETRLAAFRLLIAAGAKGMPAGVIAEQLGVPQNTLSSHLNILANAGLVTSQRQSRHIIYRVAFEQVRDLLAFLMQDCCQASARSCEDALAKVLPQCC